MHFPNPTRPASHSVSRNRSARSRSDDLPQKPHERGPAVPVAAAMSRGPQKHNAKSIYDHEKNDDVSSSNVLNLHTPIFHRERERDEALLVALGEAPHVT